MKIEMQNQNAPFYEALFNDLMCESFGFSFEPWHKLGLWDERYESYSIIKNGAMLANVCILAADLLVGGNKLKALQLGAVATRRDYRGHGYSRMIIEHIIAKYPDTPMFLFANKSVPDFYPRFGFERTQEHKQVLSVAINNKHEAVKLSPGDSRLTDLIYNRAVFSNILDCTNTQSVHIFHQIMDYSDDMYFLPERNAVVIAKQKGNKLLIADIITEKQFTFDELAAFLPFSGVSEVEFGFSADSFGITDCWQEHNSILFTRGLMLPEKFRFPKMSET